MAVSNDFAVAWVSGSCLGPRTRLSLECQAAAVAEDQPSAVDAGQQGPCRGESLCREDAAAVPGTWKGRGTAFSSAVLTQFLSNCEWKEELPYLRVRKLIWQ